MRPFFQSVVKMFEQRVNIKRVNIKFRVKLGKSSSNTLELSRAYGEVSMKRSTVFEWHKGSKKNEKS